MKQPAHQSHPLLLFALSNQSSGNIFIGLLALFFFAAFFYVNRNKAGEEQAVAELRQESLERVQQILYDDTTLVGHDAAYLLNPCWYEGETEEKHCIKYGILRANLRASTTYRDEMKVQVPKYYSASNIAAYWQQIYGSLHLNSQPHLAEMIEGFRLQQEYYDLDRTDFATHIVTAIQHMPYWYVLSNQRQCQTMQDQYDAPCISGIRFGLLSPTEMAATTVGDCDSRALLLYTILRAFDYEPVVFTSDEYRHAMLGLPLPVSGDYKVHRGRKFYFWETTAKGWGLGMLPPDTPNKDYWHVSLTFDA